MIVPLVHEIEPTLLYPAVEILLRDFVGIMKNPIIRREYLHRRFFDRNASVAQFGVIRGKVAAVEVASAVIVLHNQSSAIRNEVEQLLIIRDDFFLCVVGADTEN